MKHWIKQVGSPSLVLSVEPLAEFCSQDQHSDVCVKDMMARNVLLQ